MSTAIIGVCVMDDDGRPLTFDHIDLRKQRTMAAKYREARRRIVGMLVAHEAMCSGPLRHFVEERLGGFTRGLTNQNTLLKLAAINAVVSFILGDHGEVVHIAPVSAKAIVGLRVPKGTDKKTAAIKFAQRVPTFVAPMKKGGRSYKDHVGDMADAYVLACAGFKKIRDAKGT